MISIQKVETRQTSKRPILDQRDLVVYQIPDNKDTGENNPPHLPDCQRLDIRFQDNSRAIMPIYQ